MIVESLPDRPLRFAEVAELNEHPEVLMAWPIFSSGYADEPFPRLVWQLLVRTESGHVGLSWSERDTWRVVARDDDQDVVTAALADQRARC